MVEDTRNILVVEPCSGKADLSAEFLTTLRHALARAIQAHYKLEAEESVMATISLSIEVERRLTDLEHLAELLHRKTNGKKLSAASVLRYLEEIAVEQDDSEENLRRIDSDAKAIQITTMHTSKGLEYPIVLIPYPKAPVSIGAQVFTHEGQRFVNAAPKSPWELGKLNEETREKITSEEVEGDDLRLMYVAFTRAKHQLVVWWANSKDMSFSPLARLLFGDHEDISSDYDCFRW